jgi:hypothetical protein
VLTSWRRALPRDEEIRARQSGTDRMFVRQERTAGRDCSRESTTQSGRFPPNSIPPANSRFVVAISTACPYRLEVPDPLAQRERRATESGTEDRLADRSGRGDD